MQLNEVKNMTNDEFAKFVASHILAIENYNFDMFYDIKIIVEKLNGQRHSTSEPKTEILHLMVRPTGTDLISPKDENYKIYLDRSTKVFNLEFCWNCDYMHKIPFCKVTRLQ